MPIACLMTSTDGNDFVPAQEKLEWVTPKISLMEAGDTEGKVYNFSLENPPWIKTVYGPS